MKKTTALKILNPILFVLILAQAASVVIMKLGLAMDSIFQIHGMIGYGIGITAFLHIWLNWNWIKANFFPKASKSSVN